MSKDDETKIREVLTHLNPTKAVLNLTAAEDEPRAVRSVEYQEGLQQVQDALTADGFKVSSLMRFEESAGSPAFLLGQFTFDLVKVLGPAGIGAIGGWLATRNGRKARLKIDNIEAEARTPEEVAILLELAKKFLRSIC